MNESLDIAASNGPTAWRLDTWEQPGFVHHKSHLFPRFELLYEKLLTNRFRYCMTTERDKKVTQEGKEEWMKVRVHMINNKQNAERVKNKKK